MTTAAPSKASGADGSFFARLKLQFRDQLLMFLDGALGTRRGELGALRWSDCNFDSMSFSVQHSYYWRRGGHLKATKTEASAKLLPMHLALKGALLEWKSQNEYNGPGDFVFPSHRTKGRSRWTLPPFKTSSCCTGLASVSQRSHVLRAYTILTLRSVSLSVTGKREVIPR